MPAFGEVTGRVYDKAWGRTSGPGTRPSTATWPPPITEFVPPPG